MTRSAPFDLQAIVRPNIWALKPYRCARDDYSTGILLDANENSIGPVVLSPASELERPDGFPFAETDGHLNRYPDPHQHDTKSLLCKYRNLPYGPECLFVGVGSDESIDLIMRVFCVPGKDKVLICPPTYGMYTVAAQTNDVGIVKVNLNVEAEGEDRFQLRVDEVTETWMRSALSPAHAPLSLLDQICSLFRPNDQNNHPLFARKPNRRRPSTLRHPVTSRIPRVQRNRRR
jgi:histidinol-phosphate aminotransferase